MARRYVNGVQATNTSGTPVFGIMSPAASRFRIYDFISGCESTPTDDATALQFQRASTPGTASTSAAGVQALDPQDPTAAITFNLTWAANPTLSSNPLLYVAQNTRATFRWVAAPDSELLCAQGTSNGILLKPTLATTAKTFDWTVFWLE